MHLHPGEKSNNYTLIISGVKPFQLSAVLLQEGMLILAKFSVKMQKKYLLNTYESSVFDKTI